MQAGPSMNRANFGRQLPVVLLWLALGVTAGRAESRTLGPLKLDIDGPPGWTVTCPDPLVFFEPKNQGSIQIHVTAFPAGAVPEEMHRLHLISEQGRVKTGELATADEKVIGGLKGVLTVESTKDPVQRRMQWIANDPRAYVNATCESPAAAFEAYRPQFLKALESARFSAGSSAPPSGPASPEPSASVR